MNLKLQISLRNALLATAFLAAWLAVVGYTYRITSQEFLTLMNWTLWRSLVIALPACAIGTLFNKTWLGVVCGAASAAAFYGWELLMQSAMGF